MLLTRLGFASFNVGRYSGLLAGGPNYMLRFKNYTYSRLLYHSGLDEVLLYPQVPTRTLNFSFDMLPRVDWTEAKTLSANLTQQWEAVYHDVVIKEVFGAEGGLGLTWSFIHSLYKFWTTVLGVGEFMIWRPFELTDKMYRVRVVNVLIDGEEFDPTYVGRQLPDKYVKASVEVWYKLIPAFAPNATVYATGGGSASTT